MREVTMYMANDGKLFETVEACKRHDCELEESFKELWDAMETLKDYCSDKDCELCPFSNDGIYCNLKLRRPDEWEKSDINVEKL